MTENLDDPKVAQSNVDKSPVRSLNEEEELDAKFQIETEAVFKRLARDIYQDDSAGVREPLTNSVTAVLQAIEHDYIEEDEGVVEITVKEDSGGISLTIRDNGVGMTMKRINEIVSVIGASEARDQGQLAGQFGMGFLAVFRLVGIDGGFEMYTNPRYSNDGPISGIWKSGGFTRDTNNRLPYKMADDEYGTVFQFMVKQDIDRDSIRDWVSTYCEWARVPVIYEEYVDSSLQFEENYGGFNKKISDTYEEDVFFEYEDEYVYASTSSDSTGQTILLDVPCSRNTSGQVSTILGSVDVRLKDENGVVVDGPNEGLMVVSDDEYQNMSQERRTDYIPQSNLWDEDIQMPKPTGTRSTLEQNRDFWDWLEQKLEEKINEKLDSLPNNQLTLDDILSLSKTKYKLLFLSLLDSMRFGRKNYNSSGQMKVKKWFKRALGTTIDDTLASQIVMLASKTRYAPRGSGSISSRSDLDYREPAMAVYDAYQNNGRIFMGCRLSKEKAEVVWEDSEHNYVFKLDSTDMYSDYEELLGWELLKDVSDDNIDEFDVSQETKEKISGSKSKSSGSSSKKTLNFHVARKSYTQEVAVSDLEDRLGDSDQDVVMIGSKKIRSIILFPTHKDRMISDNYWAIDSYSAMARCSKSDWNRLKQYDMVKTLDQKIEEGTNNVSFVTSEGLRTVSEFESNRENEDKRILFHILEEPYKTRMSGEDMLSRAQDFIDRKYDSELVYAPVTESTYLDIKPATLRHDVLQGDNHVSLISKRHKESRTRRTHNVRSDTKFYVAVRLSEWTDTSEVDNLYGLVSTISLRDGGYELVETVKKGLESEAFSLSEDTVESQIEEQETIDS